MSAAVVVAGLVVVLSGCGDESGAGSSLQGKSYLSTAVTENGKPKQLAPKTRIQLQFLPDGRLSANAGCNSMGAEKVSMSGGKLGVKDLAITDMGCDTPRAAQDNWLAKLLTSSPTWKLTGDKLEISSGSTEISLVDKEKAEPDLTLDGTRWTLDAVVSGETASHSTGVAQAHLTINGERVTGSTGCNDFQGPVSITGSKITFGELAVTNTVPCPTDANAVQVAVYSTLRGDVTYTIDANHLQLRRSDGSGLDLVGR
ncbi:META domain-containing protein [Kribbella monticola]|uniref:META domain-containing protein n=1 Tax=Kribbella monticola TaxID=2185285 RepID=UPI000DD3CC5D|nr:META domain-containing protein [Kribbella monticola]